MNVISRRLWVRLIDRQTLIRYKKHRGFTNETLAIECGTKRHRSAISHLCGGQRETCSPELAAKIEKALNVPPGSLFVTEVATASVGIRQSA